MPIFSYIVHPQQGQTDALAAKLGAFPGCEVHPSNDSSVLVLVTDSPDETTDKELQTKIEALPELQSMALVFGHTGEGLTSEEEL